MPITLKIRTMNMHILVVIPFPSKAFPRSIEDFDRSLLHQLCWIPLACAESTHTLRKMTPKALARSATACGSFSKSSKPSFPVAREVIPRSVSICLNCWSRPLWDSPSYSVKPSSWWYRAVFRNTIFIDSRKWRLQFQRSFIKRISPFFWAQAISVSRNCNSK